MGCRFCSKLFFVLLYHFKVVLNLWKNKKFMEKKYYIIENGKQAGSFSIE